MRWLNLLSTRLHALFRREAVIGDMDEELRLHLELEAEANIGRGMTPEEARRAARRSFGNFDSIREKAYEIRGGGLMESMLQDVRYGARVLAKQKGFTAVAVLTLALGIGANTAIFSVVDHLLLRPLPFPGADRIVTLWELNPDGQQNATTSTFNFRGLSERSSSFEAMAAFTDRRINLTGGGEPEEIPAQLTTPELFRVVGVEPMLGRAMRAEDALPNAPDVVILSHGFWQRRYNGDPKMVGKAVTINGQPFEVIGVMPAGFQWHIRNSSGTGRPPEVWVPITLPAEQPQSLGRFLTMAGRLKPGVSIEQAKAELNSIASRLEREAPPGYNKGLRVQAVPLREQFVGNLRPALLILLGAVGFVLLIACANVANLLLSRAAAREREIVLRTAIGARRLRVVRQLLTEGLLLSVLGCLVGLLFAWWGLQALVAISPPELVDLQGVTLNLPVLALTVVVSLVTGLLFGLAPALEATRLNLNDALKEGGKGGAGQGTRSRRLRGTLVVAEVALALVLLAGAGLLVRSFHRLQNVDPGFRTDNVLTLVVPLAGAKYDTDQKMTAFFSEASERIRRLPGVREAGMVNFLPFYGGLGTRTSFAVEGRPASTPGEEPSTDVRVADAGFFRTLGIPVKRGRNLTPIESSEARRVVLINEALARRYFPGEDPIGKRLLVEMFWEPRPTEIVGIVGDVRFESLVDDAQPTVYFPVPELTYNFMTFVIRSDGDPENLAPMVRRELRAIDPNQPISSVRTLEEVMSDTVGRARFNTLLLGLFAALATLLAAVGIFGVMNYSVTLRTREIGLRMALGARPREVLLLILRQGLLLTLIGIAIGLAGALALTRVLSSLLFGIGSTDPATFAAIVILLIAVSFIACYIPARRATRVDPLIALRYD